MPQRSWRVKGQSTCESHQKGKTPGEMGGQIRLGIVYIYIYKYIYIYIHMTSFMVVFVGFKGCDHICEIWWII